MVCKIGGRSAQAVDYLGQQGIDAVNLDGGMIDWADAGRPMVSETGRHARTWSEPARGAPTGRHADRGAPTTLARRPVPPQGWRQLELAPPEAPPEALPPAVLPPDGAEGAQVWEA